MNKENQARIIELVKQAKPLILQEMTHEKVTEKGAADYVTNVDVAVQSLGEILYEYAIFFSFVEFCKPVFRGYMHQRCKFDCF